MNRRNIRSFKTWALTSAAVAAIASPAWAQETRRFDIPQQGLVAALEAFGRQGGAEIMFSKAQAEGRATSGVSGEYEPGQALAMLLQGSGLKFRQVNGNTYVVEASDPQSGSAAGDGADGTVQALIVTAQKREEDIQDVPIAISAFTQEDLTRSQVAGGPDLMTQVPNFTFTKTNFSSYSIQIRGIGTQAISATTDAAVAVAFNNTPFIRNRFFEQEFYDLERVEVLRGPQGTLYGRNATAGVVNIISAKPKFAYEAKLSGDVGNYDSTRFEGMVNVPLVEDKVALRIAGAWTKRDGYSTNQITGNPIDGRDLWSTRLSLRFAPTERIDANLIWEHFKEDDDRLRSGKQLCHQDDRTSIAGHTVYPITGYSNLFSQGCLPASLYSPDSFEAPNGYALPYYLPLGQIFLPTVAGFNPYASLTQSRDLRVIESTVDPHYRAETDLAELQFTFDIANGLTLTSETGYLSDDLFSTQDFNRFNTASGAFVPTSGNGFSRDGVSVAGPNGGIFCDPQIGCADRLVAVDLSTAKSRHFSQEFRISSNYNGSFNFSLGANFLRYDTEDKYYVFINTLSMYAAVNPYGGGNNGAQLPYVGGESDNSECLRQGFAPPNFAAPYNVTGCVYIDPNSIGSLNDMGHNYFLSRNPFKLISYAAFGEAYYNVNDTLKVTAGLRWTVDKKEAPQIPSWVLAAGEMSDSASGAGYSVAEVIDQEWREPTGRLTIDWKPDLSFTDETLLYASFAHGYKAGGANPPPAGVVLYGGGGSGSSTDAGNYLLEFQKLKPRTFEPEFVNAYEVGAKNTLLDGRLTLNGDVFYYDYTGYQISQIIDRSAVNYNFDAKVWGAELEADWRPLENLRLGLKLGYEKTRVADGEKAIDIMDRNAGHHEGSDDVWVVVRPFPTFTSNCVVPLFTLIKNDGSLGVGPNSYVNGQLGPCEDAYFFGNDPVTKLPYVPNPTTEIGGGDIQYYFPGYIGWNPNVDLGQNGGQGFYTDLSGHELPNAPHYTATLTADYTLPLPSNWLMTLHTDLYYQSEAWTRIFNMPGYDKLKAYTNVNLAAILSNEDAGWKIMAYVKNLMDRDSITGAFLNSDDTGLTTNVFLTEPRLYGLRVTKEWDGGPWWTGAGPGRPGPYPLTIEIGGQVQRQDAPYRTLAPSFDNAFPDNLNPTVVQNRDLDRGDGREVRAVYRPVGSPWQISAGFRYGRANMATRLHQDEIAGSHICRFPISSFFGKALCDPTYAALGYPPGHFYQPYSVLTPRNWSDGSVVDREEHKIADFAVGRDFGFGLFDRARSSLGFGLRYAEFSSSTDTAMDGIPDWNVPDGWALHPSTHHRYTASLGANREFKGTGPVLIWEAAPQLTGDGAAGHLDLDWSIAGGVLFGSQKTDVQGAEAGSYFSAKYNVSPIVQTAGEPVPVAVHRGADISVPVLDVSLGLSYEIQRVKVSTGYRWERYFNVLDAGYAEHKSYDRTIDGPYFKIAVGFGG